MRVSTAVLTVAVLIPSPWSKATIPDTQPTRPSDKAVASAREVFERLSRSPRLAAKEHERLEQLVRNLGHDDWQVRDEATQQLSTAGPTAAPLVRKAAESQDTEVRLRANRILQQLTEKAQDVGPRLNQAIDTLIAAGDRSVVALLIGLLDNPLEDTRYAAEYGLRRVTGMAFGYNAYAERQQRAAARKKWQHWWQKNQKDFAFDEVPKAKPPYGILVCNEMARQLTAVTLSGRVLWTRKLSRKFFCAAALPNGNVIVGYERGEKHVVEYAPDFRPVWDTDRAKLGQKLVYDIRRLPNGNTLIAYPYSPDGHVTELTRDGKVVWQKGRLKAPGAFHRLRNGNTLISENHGRRVIEVDRAGAIVWAKDGLENPCDVQKLPNGNVLIAEWNQNRVIEVNRLGGIVWQRKCPANPSSAFRLPDGTTVLTNPAEGAVIVGWDGRVIRVLLKHRGHHGKIRPIPRPTGRPGDS